LKTPDQWLWTCRLLVAVWGGHCYSNASLWCRRTAAAYTDQKHNTKAKKPNCVVSSIAGSDSAARNRYRNWQVSNCHMADLPAIRVGRSDQIIRCAIAGRVPVDRR